MRLTSMGVGASRVLTGRLRMPVRISRPSMSMVLGWATLTDRSWRGRRLIAGPIGKAGGDGQQYRSAKPSRSAPGRYRGGHGLEAGHAGLARCPAHGLDGLAGHHGPPQGAGSEVLAFGLHGAV